MSHTPGPWVHDQSDGTIGSIWGGGIQVAQAQATKPTRVKSDHKERLANAALIAAAPELLAALREAQQEIQWWVNEHGCCAGHESRVADRIDAVLAELRK